METKQFFVRCLSTVVNSFLIMACSSSDESVFQPSMSVNVKMEATNDINAFEDDIARPLVVRVYQLKETGAFEKADFISLYESDSTVLAGTLVDTKVLAPVLPEEKRSFVLEVQQEAKAIAVFAEFADYEVAVSKGLVALVEEPDENPIIIRISQTKIEITQPVDSSWW